VSSRASNEKVVVVIVSWCAPQHNLKVVFCGPRLFKGQDASNKFTCTNTYSHFLGAQEQEMYDLISKED
jgi:hypothetical protein